MSKRIELVHQLRESAEIKHRLVDLALQRVADLEAALDGVKRGDPGAAAWLDALCGFAQYEGAIFLLRLDNILQAETDRVEAQEQLEALDAEKPMVESDR